MASYWDNVLQKRISRRRAIAATGTTAAAAAFLAACGGGDDDDEGPSAVERDQSGLLSEREHDTESAVRGGVFKVDNGSNRDPLHWDGKAQGQVQLNQFQGMAYEALVRNQPGLGRPSTWSAVDPQLAESWEESSDKLQITFKLRQGVKWHNVAPVNGREFDSEDVLKTWENFISAETPNNKGQSANSINPAAPIVRWEAPDANTVVLHLARPTSMIYQRLASMITGEVGSIYPKEYGQGFDAKSTQIGTGGWILDTFEPSSRIVYQANPDYWNRDNAAFFDTIEMTLLPEYAQKLAQFKAGNLSTIADGVQAQDIIPTKQERPDISMISGVEASNSQGATMRFGWDPIEGNPSPFLDVRVRRALSMAEDRESFIDVFYDVSKFQAEGLPVDTYFFTQMGVVPDWTLDPRDAETFGENAQYYEYNMAEAKKLFEAAQADYPGGKFPKFVAGRVNAVFGPVYTEQTEVMDQFARDLGFEVEAFPLDYNLDYLPKVVTQQGHFQVPNMGWAYAIGAVTSPDPTDLWTWRYYSKSGVTSGSLGLGTEGAPTEGVAEIDALIEQAMGEFDAEARREIIHDLQRIASGHLHNVPFPGRGDEFFMAWPAVRNWWGFQNDSRTAMYQVHGLYNLWMDSSKPHG